MINRDARAERVAIFEDTKRLYTTDKRLIDSVNFSKQNQQIIEAGEEVPAPKATYDEPAKVVVSRRRSLEAAKQYTNLKVCVLNFASATNAGGGVTKGSSAQEEAICRCSTLYPCIADDKVMGGFHYKHRNALQAGQMNALYNDDCIYTPKVMVFKEDTAHPKLLPENEWYDVDIISCAAPNLRNKPSNAMNPSSGDKAVSIKSDELSKLHKKRMGRIFDIAGLHGVEVVILGAFGCGAFQNPPNIVAEAIYEIIENYRNHFRVIEFAVYCSPKDTGNYDAFKRVFASMAE
ncbi:MAG: TIGR02452 family protein [Bacteroidales bacterium]|nr:TIGR02452 family protein [Lachnoclostridium sp.]MCM1384483.1 TIGR02452 family protein [Lachnoclostridium sp.]MCM1464028.1 TIGR02452 family protein [Bacteroidales bacterium]